jgi:hypothetical protein
MKFKYLDKVKTTDEETPEGYPAGYVFTLDDPDGADTDKSEIVALLDAKGFRVYAYSSDLLKP